MALYEIKSDAIVAVAPTAFGLEHVRERTDLQRLLRANISVVCPDTMVLAEEFCDWDDSRRRIDLLALDKNASLVVVELKRSEGGLILDFLGWDEPNEETFAQAVRIVLVSAEFSKELTTAVLWLNESGLDIRCVRMKPYSLDGRVLVDVQQIIPLPEAAEYTVRVARKDQQQKAAREAQRDYTKFDVIINGVRHERLPKRRLMFVLIRHLVDQGIAPEKIAGAVPRRGDRLFRSADGSLDHATFVERVAAQMKQQDRAFDPERYFCETEELMHVGGRTYAVTNQWGASTQETIDALLTAFGARGISIEASPEG